MSHRTSSAVQRIGMKAGADGGPVGVGAGRSIWAPLRAPRPPGCRGRVLQAGQGR